MKMDSCPGGEVNPNYLLRMTQIRNGFLCTILPRDVGYVIAGEREVHRPDARGDHFCHCPFVPLRQFATHGIEIELGQTPFGSVIPDRFLMYPYPFALPKRVQISVLASAFQFYKRIYIIHEKSALDCFESILEDLLLVQLISLVSGAPFKRPTSLVHCPLTNESTFLISRMDTFLT